MPSKPQKQKKIHYASQIKCKYEQNMVAAFGLPRVPFQVTF